MDTKYIEKSAAWQEAITAVATEVAPTYVNIDGMSIDELIFNILLNDELSEKTASQWDKYFRKQYGLKALFCGSEIQKLPPTAREAFLLAEEVYEKLPKSYDEKVADEAINKKSYTFAQRGEVAHFDNAGSSLGVVIRVDVKTTLEEGTLIYWNQGYAKGRMCDRQENLAKVYILNFIDEFDEEQAIGRASTIKAVDFF
jgi:hypothetical protein